MTTHEDLARLALALPGVTEGIDDDSYETGSRIWYDVDGKGFAWTYTEKVPGRRGRILHPDVIACRVADVEEKLALIASEPDKFFTDDHYNGFPAVLVRLDAIDVEEMAELLAEAWHTRAKRKRIAEFKAVREAEDAAGTRTQSGQSTAVV
jgi:hypothetical protein